MHNDANPRTGVGRVDEGRFERIATTVEPAAKRRDQLIDNKIEREQPRTLAKAEPYADTGASIAIATQIGRRTRAPSNWPLSPRR